MGKAWKRQRNMDRGAVRKRKRYLFGKSSYALWKDNDPNIWKELTLEKILKAAEIATRRGGYV